MDRHKSPESNSLPVQRFYDSSSSHSSPITDNIHCKMATSEDTLQDLERVRRLLSWIKEDYELVDDEMVELGMKLESLRSQIQDSMQRYKDLVDEAGQDSTGLETVF